MSTIEFHGADLVVYFSSNPSNVAVDHYVVEYQCLNATITHRVDQAAFQSEQTSGVRDYQDTLTFAENSAAGLTRNVRVSVWAVSDAGRSDADVDDAQNSLPVLPSAPLVTSTLTGVEIAVPQPVDGDLEGYVAWVGTTADFPLDAAHERYRGAANTFALQLPTDNTYYVRIAPFDAFDLDTFSTWPAQPIKRRDLDTAVGDTAKVKGIVDGLNTTGRGLAAEQLKNGVWRAEQEKRTVDPVSGAEVLEIIEQVGVQTEHNSAWITEQRTVSSDGTARAALAIRADGRVAGYVGQVTGARGSFYIVADEFGVVDPDDTTGAAIKPFSVVDGVTYLDHAKVRKLDVDVVNSENLTQSAVQRTNYQMLPNDVQCPTNTWTDVVTITIDKQEAESLLKIVCYAAVRHPDDLIFLYEITVDGVSVSPARKVRMPFDNSGSDGQMPITPFAFANNLAKGAHTVRFRIQNQDTEGPLTVYAGSAIEITELKRGAL